MNNNVHTGTEPSMADLVRGIVTDFQDLVGQQMALVRREIKDDMARTRDASLTLLGGGLLVLVGGICLVTMLAYLLSHAFPSLPLWASYGIVGGVFAVLGGVLVYLGKKQFESFNPLPDESAKALKENVQWLTTNTPK